MYEKILLFWLEYHAYMLNEDDYLGSFGDRKMDTIGARDVRKGDSDETFTEIPPLFYMVKGEKSVIYS